jgi:3-(3-hydroxy-phenyl)propionate hydroxylase
MEDPLYDVAIAGFGPTGATLAGLLGRRGWRVLVLERDAEVYRLPRAVHFDHEVMRIFQTLGLAGAVLPHTRVLPRCVFLNAQREVLFETRTDNQIGGWASDYMFHQPSLEQLLRDAAGARPNVTVRYGALDDVEDGDDGVTARLAEEGAARARFLVGCDGAASTVRKRVGLELEDLGFDEPWVVVDLLGAEGLPDHTVQFCDPARPTTLVPGAHGHHRFEFMLRPGESDADMLAPETLRGLLAAWLDPDRVELVRAAVYRFHAVVAREWWRGRVGIAGDAAHQTPPFLGQGMCAGIRDAMNLDWKLDLVLRGLAAPALLETYGSERAPHVREFIERAVSAGRIVCTQDVELACVRDAELKKLREQGGSVPIPMTLPMPGPGVFQRSEHGKVGRLAPQPSVRVGEREALLDDVGGSGFRLVLRDARGWPDAARLRRFAELGGTVVVWQDEPAGRSRRDRRRDDAHVEDTAAGADAYFARQGLHAFVVRPDHLVYGVAAEPGEVAGLLDALATDVTRR